MNDSQRKILEMLADKKITVDEASRLLAAIDQPPKAEGRRAEGAQAATTKPKYLRVQIEPGAEGGSTSAERVNVRVPLGLIRAGMKLTALIPSAAVGKVSEALSDKGIDLDLRSLKTGDLEQLLEALSDLEVDVQNGKEKVHVYVE
jgi:Fe-S-cluster formation regulator IscX/YfhJ